MQGKRVSVEQRERVLRAFNIARHSVLAIATEENLCRQTVSEIVGKPWPSKAHRKSALKLPTLSGTGRKLKKCPNGHGVVQWPCYACAMEFQKLADFKAAGKPRDYEGPLAMPIADMGIEPKSVEALEKMGCVYLGDLQGITEDELRAHGNWGPVYIEGLKAAMRRALGG